MILVIFGHFCPEWSEYFVFTSPIKIPLFFAITGYCFNFRDGDALSWIRNILRKLVLPWLILSLVWFKVFVALIKGDVTACMNYVVEEKEMLDLVAIAQSSPGAIAINGAIVVGYKLAGIAGVLVSIIGTVIPPFVIIALLSVCYNTFRSNELVSQMLEGMQAGVGAVIASVTYEMGTGVVKEKDGISLLIMAGAFVASCVFEVNVVYIVIICGLLGVLRTCMSRKGAGK